MRIASKPRAHRGVGEGRGEHTRKCRWASERRATLRLLWRELCHARARGGELIGDMTLPAQRTYPKGAAAPQKGGARN